MHYSNSYAVLQLSNLYAVLYIFYVAKSSSRTSTSQLVSNLLRTDIATCRAAIAAKNAKEDNGMFNDLNYIIRNNINTLTTA